MTFPEAMSAVIGGHAVRRAAWGPRRAVRLMLMPFNFTQTRVMMFDTFGQVPAFSYPIEEEDLFGRDWEIMKESDD